MNGTDSTIEKYGIEFVSEPVSKQRGDHATDRVVIGNARIAVPRNLAKIVEVFGEECVLGSLNGTSWRVMSQDVSRRNIEKGVKDAETLDAAIINRLRGVRNASHGGVTTVTKTVYTTPAGTYDGTDEVELQAQWIAELTEQGVPFEMAKAIAGQQKISK
jgi:hypothetical protein